MRRTLLLTLLLVLPMSFTAWAQDDSSNPPPSDPFEDDLFGGGDEDEGDSDGDSDDDIFGGDSFIQDAEEDPDFVPGDDLLTSDGVTIGGEIFIAADLSADFSGNDAAPPNAPDDGDDPFLTAGLGELRARLFLDARPDPNLRVLIKSDLSYETSGGVDFTLREIFVDTDFGDRVFLRTGKQTINWGVGFFFSPANLINLETIDPEDPDAELVGPVAVRAQYPIGINNFTGYLILDDQALEVPPTFAARYEFLVDGFEITTGTTFQPNNPFAVMATATGGVPVDIPGDLSAFGEVVLEGNAERRFVEEGASGDLVVVTSSGPFFSATLGGRYSFTSDNDLVTLIASAQYFYNGPGYGDPAILLDNPREVRALVGNGLLLSDLIGTGRHYVGASLNAPDLAGSDLSPGLFWVANLTDGSGIVNASVRYGGLDYLTPEASFRYGYGPAGGEYSGFGTGANLSVGFTLRAPF